MSAISATSQHTIAGKAEHLTSRLSERAPLFFLLIGVLSLSASLSFIVMQLLHPKNRHILVLGALALLCAFAAIERYMEHARETEIARSHHSMSKGESIPLELELRVPSASKYAIALAAVFIAFAFLEVRWRKASGEVDAA